MGETPKKTDGRRNNSRPTKHRIEAADIEKIEKAAGYGLTVEQIAGLFGMSKATFDRKRQRNSKINEAIEKGRSLAIENVAKSLYQRATGFVVPDTKLFYNAKADKVVSETINKVI